MDIYDIKKDLETRNTKHIILDTDTYNEVDDQFALAYAALHRRDFRAAYPARHEPRAAYLPDRRRGHSRHYAFYFDVHRADDADFFIFAHMRIIAHVRRRRKDLTRSWPQRCLYFA